jgi:hypothetical protein
MSFVRTSARAGDFRRRVLQFTRPPDGVYEVFSDKLFSLSSERLEHTSDKIREVLWKIVVVASLKRCLETISCSSCPNCLQMIATTRLSSQISRRTIGYFVDLSPLSAGNGNDSSDLTSDAYGTSKKLLLEKPISSTAKSTISR